MRLMKTVQGKNLRNFKGKEPLKRSLVRREDPSFRVRRALKTGPEIRLNTLQTTTVTVSKL
jgi:hypothetical protein